MTAASSSVASSFDPFAVTSTTSKAPSLRNAEVSELRVASLSYGAPEDEPLSAFVSLSPSINNDQIMSHPASGRPLDFGIVPVGERRSLPNAIFMAHSQAKGVYLGGELLRIPPAASESDSAKHFESAVLRTMPHWSSSSLLELQRAAFPSHLDYLASLVHPAQSTVGIAKSGPSPLDHLPLHPMPGNTAPYSDPNPDNKTLFIGAVPSYVTEDMLLRLFERFGEIDYIKLPMKRGCAFIAFVRRRDAEHAMVSMHGYRIATSVQFMLNEASFCGADAHSRLRLSWGREQFAGRSLAVESSPFSFDRDLPPFLPGATPEIPLHWPKNESKALNQVCLQRMPQWRQDEGKTSKVPPAMLLPHRVSSMSPSTSSSVAALGVSEALSPQVWPSQIRFAGPQAINKFKTCASYQGEPVYRKNSQPVGWSSFSNDDTLERIGHGLASSEVAMHNYVDALVED